MNHSKKLLSLFLVFVMAFSMTTGYVAKATTAITVTLRIEQDQKTLTAPIQLTLTEDDIKSYGTLNFPTDKMTPYHVLAKYLITEKGATEDTLANYIGCNNGWLSGISVNGNISKDFGSASSDPAVQDAYWMFAVNDESPVDPATGYGYTIDAYPVQDKDEITFYGVWGGDYTAGISPYYATFAEKDYKVTQKQNLDVTLLGFDIFKDYDIKANRPMKGAHIVAYDAHGQLVETPDIVTDENGKASLQFEHAGVYTISAYRKTTDGAHYDISHPYATVTVHEIAEPTATATPGSVPDNGSISTITLNKVKSVKATVKKAKSKTKKITVTWKKVKNATNYYVYLSRQKGKGYKKIATVKKEKAVIRKKKGTYFIKICAHSKNATPNKGAYSTPVKVKVK